MDLIHRSFLLSLGAETDRNSASELICILWIPAILARRRKRVQKTICERKAADFILETRLIGIFAAFSDKFREMADSTGCRTSYLSNLLQKGDKKR
jgi:hypothetical protein